MMGTHTRGKKQGAACMEGWECGCYVTFRKIHFIVILFLRAISGAWEGTKEGISEGRWSGVGQRGPWEKGRRECCSQKAHCPATGAQLVSPCLARPAWLH